ncbi:ebs-bah-phd domain-containing protein [Purpureocillium lavendulum]|uniref:Ebs-bah-phd domain-containing protein n=1 Tax=Purpureocillium lavendulum TaxID=1247861 RepID=A0AB34FEE7_9HYPO|nr:ebs-bah-phd domain-containing protein [Purpureocillium lavendulum]
MTRYNSFKLNPAAANTAADKAASINSRKYFIGDYVYIANDATIGRQVASDTDTKRQGLLQCTGYWVAKILEIRALDEYHVYARVYWMYSPDELPPKTLDQKKAVSGRQPYHGVNELIASNHMDVVNVLSVAAHAVVNQWVEADDDQVQESLYWRQAFDCRTSQLSSVDLICKCKTPANPDKTLVACTTPRCEQWLHYECLLHAVLTRVYNALGIDKPHNSHDLPVMMVSENEGARTFRSTPASDVARECSQTSVDPRQGTSGDDIVPAKSLGSPTTTDIGSPASGAAKSLAVGKSSKPSLAKKNGQRKRQAAERKEPYEGLFEAELKLDCGST